MCTCLKFENGGFYFGRNLDLEYSFGEQVVITPRNYPFVWKSQGSAGRHYAMVGMATVLRDTPLYADAMNEKGLCMAGLNFPGNACYQKEKEGAKNVASFELISWILSSCATVGEAEILLRQTNITDAWFDQNVTSAPLHWMLADKEKCLVLEPMEEGLRIYENPYGVLTNNPPFPYHEINLQNYLNVTASYPENRMSRRIGLKAYGQGMGGMGLPGDASPASRFVRTVFLKETSVCAKEETANVTQCFHILDQVGMVKGAVRTEKGHCDVTTYSSCAGTERGIYYYKTYENNQIQAVGLGGEDLEQSALICYKLDRCQSIRQINERNKMTKNNQEKRN